MLQRTLLTISILVLLVACGDIINIIDPPEPPTAPSNIRTSALEGAIALTWQDNSEDESGFTIYRQNESEASQGRDFNVITTTGPNVTEFLDDSVKTDQAYFYAVAAIGENDLASELITPQNPQALSPLPENTAPTTTGFEDINVLQGAAAQVLDLSTAFSDAEQDSNELSYKVENSNSNVVEAQLDGSVLSLNFLGLGSSILTLQAEDAQGLSVSTSFTITVEAIPNEPPTASIIDDISVTQGSDPLSIDLQNFFDDPEDGPAGLLYSISNNTDTSVVNPTLDGSLLTLNFLSLGLSSLTISATDSAGASVITAFDVSVTDRAPPDNKGIEDIQVNEGAEPQVFDLLEIFSGEDLSFAILDNSAPEVATVALDEHLLEIGFSSPGSSNIKLQAIDNLGSTSELGFNVFVNGYPSAAIIPNLFIGACDPVFSNFFLGDYFSDAEGFNNLDFEVTQNSNPAVVDIVIDFGNMSLTALREGQTEITLSATDSSGASASTSFTFTVTLNHVPLAQDLADIGLVLGDSPLVIDLTTIFIDPDEPFAALDLTVNENSQPDVASIQLEAGQLIISPLSGGETEVSISARDCQQQATFVNFNVNVIPSSPILHVNANINAGLNDGSSWENAFKYLQDALTFAREGQTIFVAQGTYYPDEGLSPTNDDRHASFQLKNGVGIYGGFQGLAHETAISDANPVRNPTILSGDLDQNRTHSTRDAFHVVTTSGVNRSAILNGFTITGGFANEEITGDVSGAGVNNVMGSPSLVNLIIDNNVAQGKGGGMYNTEASPYLSQVIIQNNTASHSGGGIYNHNSSPILENVLISRNAASSQGGGMYNYGSAPQFSQVSIQRNQATQGGGVYNHSTSISHLSVNGNYALAGGGIYNITNNGASLSNANISGNTAFGQGGGIYNRGSSLSISNVTMTGNVVGNNGRAIYNYNSSPTISNSIFMSGDTPFVTSIANENSSPKISFSLFDDASLPADSVDLGNNLLNSNPRFLRAVDCGASINSGGCGDDPTTDPDESADDNYGDLQLRHHSPAIDAGNNAATTVSTDVVGQSRRFDDSGVADTGNGTAPLVDMGAFEKQSHSP